MFMDLEHVKTGGVRLLSVRRKWSKKHGSEVESWCNFGRSKIEVSAGARGSKSFARVVLLSNQVGTQPAETSKC